MATREEQLQARVKELEGKLANATHAVGHAIQNLGGEVRIHIPKRACVQPCVDPASKICRGPASGPRSWRSRPD
jgi:hypothetical protein